MAWRLEGSYFENCSCNSVCPCNTSSVTQPADNDYCHAVVAFHLDSGEIDGLDLSDRSVVLVLDAPGEMAQGNWKVGLIIDDQASDEQADALGKIFGCQLGGPMAALAPLIGEMLGVERLPIAYVDDGLKHSLKVGNAIDISMDDFVPPGMPEGAVSKLTGIALPWGPDIAISTVERATVNIFGRNWDQGGKNGNSAPISWSG